MRQRTGRQGPVIGLGIEIDFDHLAPTPRAKDSQDVGQITLP